MVSTRKEKAIVAVAAGSAVVLGTALLMRARTRQQLRRRYESGALTRQPLSSSRDDYLGPAGELNCKPSTSPSLEETSKRTRELLKRLPKWLRKVGPDRP